MKNLVNKQRRVHNTVAQVAVIVPAVQIVKGIQVLLAKLLQVVQRGVHLLQVVLVAVIVRVDPVRAIVHLLQVALVQEASLAALCKKLLVHPPKGLTLSLRL